MQKIFFYSVLFLLFALPVSGIAQTSKIATTEKKENAKTVSHDTLVKNEPAKMGLTNSSEQTKQSSRTSNSTAKPVKSSTLIREERTAVQEKK